MWSLVKAESKQTRIWSYDLLSEMTSGQIQRSNKAKERYRCSKL